MKGWGGVKSCLGEGREVRLSRVRKEKRGDFWAFDGSNLIPGVLERKGAEKRT